MDAKITLLSIAEDIRHYTALKKEHRGDSLRLIEKRILDYAEQYHKQELEKAMPSEESTVVKKTTNTGKNVIIYPEPCSVCNGEKQIFDVTGKSTSSFVPCPNCFPVFNNINSVIISDLSNMPSDKLKEIDLPYIESEVKRIEEENGDMEQISWGMQDGVLISGNEAQIIIDLFKQSLQPKEGENQSNKRR